MRWASGNSSGREEGIQSVSGSTVSKTVTENRHEAGLALKEKKSNILHSQWHIQPK